MRLASMLIVLVSVTPALAGAGPWQQVAPDVRLRLISSDRPAADGTLLAGLQVEMPQRTNTYWRVPGETGIPVVIDWSGSTAIAKADIAWPYPERTDASGLVDHVYYGPLVLPVVVHPTGPGAHLRAELMMGICDEICVPVTATLDLPLGTAPDGGQALRLDQAMAEVPLPWDGARDAFGVSAIDKAAGGLRLGPLAPEIDPDTIIADMGANGPLFGAPQKSPDGQSVLLPLLGTSAQPSDLIGQSVQLTFRTAMGAYELSVQVADQKVDGSASVQ